MRNDDAARVSILHSLRDGRFITTGLRRSAECNKCRTRTPIREGDYAKSIVCMTCGKKVNSSTPFVQCFVESVNYESIIDKVDKVLRNFGLEVEYDSATRSWQAQVHDKSVPIIIAGVSCSDLILSCGQGEGSLIILLDRPRFQLLVNSMNVSQFIDFHSVIQDGRQLINALDNVSSSFGPSYSVELERRFDKMLEDMDFPMFEAFCIRLLEAVKERQKQLTGYYVYLGSKKDTLVNAKVVKMGGPGKYDFHVINLLDYLQSALRPDRFGESKRYSKTTTFTIRDYSLGVVHAQYNPTLFIVSTNNVQHEVWDEIIKAKSANEYRFVLLDKNLILLLLFRLELEGLIGEFAK